MGILSGRTALITGGTKGIGREIALAFLREGASVAAIYHGDDKSAEAFLSDASAIGKAIIIKADVSDSAQVAHAFERVKAELGAPLLLVNCAGVIKDGFLMLMREEDWDRVIAVNLKGTFNCSKAVCRGMIGAKYGRIINMASPSAITGRAGQTNYSASKGGVISMTKSLARELAPFGITVNAIAPGVIKTEMTETLPEKIRAELLSHIPLSKFGGPEDIASAALFLASDDAGYITGQTIAVDGGITM
ncbi:MAG: beta-ketoacyl-ACP reductase [Nitrospirota bacterium]